MSDSDTSESTKQSNFSKKMVPMRMLIELVRLRPCLWDRNLPAYKDRLEKHEAWNQIYKIFAPNFDALNQAKKNFISSKITRKWHNARDSYVKSRKDGCRNKPYLYSQELSFLDEKITNRKSKRDTIIEESEVENSGSQSWINEVFVDIEPGAAENGIGGKQPNIEFEADLEESPKEAPKEECEENIVSVLLNLIQKEEDEDRAFFKSITPAVKKLSENSKFEFRIQVMNLITSLRIKDSQPLNLKRERTSAGETDSE